MNAGGRNQREKEADEKYEKLDNRGRRDPKRKSEKLAMKQGERQTDRQRDTQRGGK